MIDRTSSLLKYGRRALPGLATAATVAVAAALPSQGAGPRAPAMATAGRFVDQGVFAAARSGGAVPRGAARGMERLGEALDRLAAARAPEPHAFLIVEPPAQPAAPEPVRALPTVASAPQQAAQALDAAGANEAAAARATEASGPLTREQVNVVRFIATRYRVASDAAQHFVSEAYRAAQAARIDPHLVLAIMSIESSFDPMSQSGRGAKGLMQVLARVHQDRFEPFGGVKAAFDPVANIRVGTSILKDYVARAGSVPGALKWYVGAALLDSDGGYGDRVLFERGRIAAVAAGRPVPADPPRLVAVAARARAAEREMRVEQPDAQGLQAPLAPAAAAPEAAPADAPAPAAEPSATGRDAADRPAGLGDA